MVYRRLKTLLQRAWCLEVCVLCGHRARASLNLCTACYAELPFIRAACYRCGLPLPTSSTACGRCLRSAPQFSRTYAALEYCEPVTWLIQRLKFEQHLTYARLLSQLWLQRYAGLLTRLPEAILPVPLHPRRLRSRGFNQALELAKPLASALQRPLLLNHCMRVRDTAPQVALPAKQRANNLRHAFALSNSLPFKSIALVDDVMTTGATVNTLARLLKHQGVDDVQVWCIARTHPRA